MPVNRERNQHNTWQPSDIARNIILDAIGCSTPQAVENWVRNMIGDGSQDRIENLVKELLHIVVSKQRNDKRRDQRNEETSCVNCGMAIGFLMRFPATILYKERLVEDQFFQTIGQELHNCKMVLIHVSLYGTTHVFGIIPLSDGEEAFVLHAWQNIHGVRAERAMKIEELVHLLKQLPQNNEVQKQLWRKIRIEQPDGGMCDRVSFITVVIGMFYTRLHGYFKH